MGRRDALALWSRVLVGVLGILAARVAVVLMRGGSAWSLIVLYWTILAVKNMLDCGRG